MSTVFEKLRLAREARGISLDDIATATRIHTKILKALEEGNISNVPQTYVRAFLRAYAKEVGLNETEILREYEQQHLENDSQNSDRRQISSSHNKTGFRKSIIRVSQTTVLAIIAGMLVLSFVVSLSLFNREEKLNEVQEIPFQDVVKPQWDKQQNRPISAVTSRSDSVPSSSTATAPEIRDVSVQQLPQQPSPRTPLVLRVMTFDSAWIRIVIDGKIRGEYYVPPRWSRQWKADDHFVVSVNNASAVSFVLNNAPLGIIGQPEKPVKNYLIQRRDIPRQHAETE